VAPSVMRELMPFELHNCEYIWKRGLKIVNLVTKPRCSDFQRWTTSSGSHGLERIVGKRPDSAYQPGQRTGVWFKHRFNRGQELVVGGYLPSSLGVDSLLVGAYKSVESPQSNYLP